MVIDEATGHLVTLYRDAYTTLLTRLATFEGRGRSTVYERALLAETAEILNQLDADARQWIEREIPRIYRNGQQDAIRELTRQGVATEGLSARITGIHRSAVRVLAENLYGDLRAAEQMVGRRVQDAIRQAGVEAVTRKVSTGETIRETKKHLQDILGQRGFIGFVDQSGREWRLDSYAEMVARTTTREATNLGTFNQLTENGYDLVRMSEHWPTCDICAQYQGRVYSLSGTDARFPALYETALSEGFETIHPNCFPAGVAVSGPSAIAQSARRYEGQLVVITTASGVELPVTPNHPILTSEGWVAAGLLNEGDQVFQYVGSERVIEPVDPNDVEVPVLIEDVAGAFRKSGTVSAICMPVSAEDFHGDGSNGNVTVVYANRLLSDRFKAAFVQPGSEGSFSDTIRSTLPFTIDSTVDQLGLRLLLATHGVMSGTGTGQPLFRGEASHHAYARFGARRSGKNTALLEPFVNHHLSNTEVASDMAFGHPGFVESDSLVNIEEFAPLPSGSAFDSAFIQPPIDYLGTDTESASKLLTTLASEITTDTIVNVERRDFAGHVYNLETTKGWYAANGIITHNCAHVFSPVVEELMDDDEFRNLRERSNRPFEDNRSQRELNAYRNAQRRKRWQTETRRMHERYSALLPNDTPPPGAFARMRQADSERWNELQLLYRDARQELREVGA